MDGKKKKNKKKKGNNSNQTRAADDVPTPPGAEETGGGGGSAAPQNHQDHHPQASDVHSVGAPSDTEPEKHKVPEEENSVKVLRQLEEEKNIWLQMEASMEERIKLLQEDINLCVGKEASLEDKFKDLQIRSDSSLLKEATLEDRVKWIEGIHDSWIKKETSITETIARLEEANIGLQVQVKELKESRDDLSEENTQLKESLAVMESRIQYLETQASFPRSSTVKITELPEGKDPNYQVEVVNIPAEQPEPENIVPLEKVKDVHPETEQQKISVDDSTKENVTAPPEAAISADYSSKYNVGTYESGEMVQNFSGAHETFGIPNGVEDFNSLNDVRVVQRLGIDNSRISEDVVSVPLDDIQVVETEPPPVRNEMAPELPLSDAPLIGAPFRLFSFVAKYVSGADLVNQEGSRSG